MYQRPNPKETQDDLLRLQDEFNRTKSESSFKLAATLVGTGNEPKPEGAGPPEIIPDQLANTFEAIPVDHNIGRIVERKQTQPMISQISFSESAGFPKPKRRNLNITPDNQAAGGSIFGRNIKKAKLATDNVPIEVNTTNYALPTQSCMVTGIEKETIHLENVAKMETMSPGEILEEKERLLSTMDPALISFLKSRRQKVPSSTPSIKEQNETSQNIDIEDIETSNEVLNEPNAEKWLNFGVIETNKLAWMRESVNPKIDKSHSFEARFDFEGCLLPYSEETMSETTRVLYHHGEEPGRLGYTLQELFQLARSNISQQKIVALNSIANILALQSTGVYQDVIEIPIEQIFFVLRFCLDDNVPSVLNSAIKAMRNLFYNKVDETCLDLLLGFGLGLVQPILSADDDPDDDTTINDQQLAETNLTKCLIRSDILSRIKYIINTVRPQVETIAYCLEILIRLSRDSHYIMAKTYKHEHLIRDIIQNFLPTEHGVPLLQAVKLLRILASRSRTISSDLVEKYRVLEPIRAYLSNEKYRTNANGLRLQTECLHLWTVLAHFGLTNNHLDEFSSVLSELLSYHYNNTDLDDGTYVRFGHIGSLLCLVGVSGVASYWPILERCCAKWMRQFAKLSEFSCGKLQMIGALFHCLSSLQVRSVDKYVMEMLTSSGFNVITANLGNGSMLLNNYETCKLTGNLKGLEAAAWYASEHVIPIIQTTSSLPFLSILSNFVQSVDNNELKLALLQHAHIVHYLDQLRHTDNYFLTNNWFTRIEANFIMNILKMAVSVRSALADTRAYYEVAMKSLSIFHADQKPSILFLLSKIVFSRDFYPSDVLLRNLTLEQRSDQMETSLQHLDDILSVYTRVLALESKIPNFATSLSIGLSGNVIPLDWIYSPIIVLYSNQQANKVNASEGDQISTIRNCLRWVLIYESYFPELATGINPTDRFCRIACVFLASDNLFLVEEIHHLLQLCLQNIVKNAEGDIDFERNIEGLSNFEDFYIQLLEQYQGVSYGDVLFGNFVLVPLAQRHSKKWRKKLWSEYSGIVEIFNLTPEQSVCSVDLFMEPHEDDLSLLKCYRRCLVNNSVRKHSILYFIAKHHVDSYVIRLKNKK